MDPGTEPVIAQPLAPPRTLRYGSSLHQEGDLYLPARSRAPVVVLLHGGFWREPHGRDQMEAIARDLQSRGFAVWNASYARMGASGCWWPCVARDVEAAVAYVAMLPHVLVDPLSVIVCGHSAGGHLALWLASRHEALDEVRVRAVVSLAGIGDLPRACELGLGDDAVAALLGGTPATVPERYAAASPCALLPLGVRQLLLHGTLDDVVPVELSRAYVRSAVRAGDEAALYELPDAGHMDFLDPSSVAHAALCECLAQLLR